MSTTSRPPSPATAIVALSHTDPEWQAVLHVSNQVVLYNPTSHALAIRPSSNLPRRTSRPCPYCRQALPPDFEPDVHFEEDNRLGNDPAYQSRASDYFRLLEIANENASRPASPSSDSPESGRAFPTENMAEGYFKAFFQEEYKLGMGANGSVFLCQHVLNGNPLGHFAVKKIAVGESQSYLLNTLREVRLLERLHHPNIITYHHAWLETCQFSSFGPRVPTLHVLMQWAEGGSLDDFINVRLGQPTQHIHIDPLARFSYTPPVSSRIDPSTLNSSLPDSLDEDSIDLLSRSARIRAFRAFQRAPPEEKARLRREMADRTRDRDGKLTPIHLLSAEEVKSLFNDIVQGLAFLHNKSVLHLDLKPGNVLLTWDEGRLIPRAMLSDFGTSRDMLHAARTRTGNTGTLEYTSPESLPSPLTGLLQPVDSKADMWSLGMILHKLLFFKLPYRYASADDANGELVSTDREGDKLDRLEKEVLKYPGFKSNAGLVTAFEARRLPRSYLMLLEGLLNVVPLGRPSVERVSTAIGEGVFDPLRADFLHTDESSSLIPVAHRRSDSSFLSPPPLRRSSVGPSNTPDEFSKHGTELDETGEMTPSRAMLTPFENESLRFTGPNEPRQWRLWTMSKIFKQAFVLVPRSDFRVSKRTQKTLLKSCVLVAKVWSARHLCPLERQGGLWRAFVLSVVLFAAVLDTVVDDIWSSLSLCGFHIAVVLGCPRTICCT